MQSKSRTGRYALVTAARNEQANIERTIQSVVSQTLLPAVWVIVSDGSTDGTDEVVARYAGDYDFIRLVKKTSDSNRDFASKVYAVRTGVENLNGAEYDFIGNLDADVTFGVDYYEKLFEIFKDRPRLGIAGGVIFEPHDGKWVRMRGNIDRSVAGCVQTFRRQCYNDIGGYLPLKKGGEDAVAEVMSRKKGWDVKTFPQLEAFHHRKSGTAGADLRTARINLGRYHYSMGYMLWYETARCLSRLQRPYIIAELLTLWGYILAFLRREEIAVPPDVLKYIRQEQMCLFKNAFRIKKPVLTDISDNNKTAAGRPQQHRICLVRHGYYPRDPRLFREVRTVVQAGYAADVLCLRIDGQKTREEVDGVRIYRLSHQHKRSSMLRYAYEYGLSFFKMTVFITLLFFKNRYKCIQVNTMPDALVFVTIIPRIFGAKILLDMQEPAPELFATKYNSKNNKWLIKLITLFERLSLKYADTALTVNETIRQRFVQRGTDKNKIHIVRNVPGREFYPDAVSRTAADDFTLMTHGMIEERYGQGVIIRALPIVRRKIEKVRLIIAGYGRDEDIRVLAEKLGCLDIITFTGLVPFDRVRDLISSADAGIVPLLRSPFSELCQPNKLFEYVACKKPVIVSRLGAIEESFDDSSVMFFEPGNHEELADCIVELHQNPEKRRQLVENAYRRFEPINWSHNQKTYLNVINNLITGKAGPD